MDHNDSSDSGVSKCRRDTHAAYSRQLIRGLVFVRFDRSVKGDWCCGFDSPDSCSLFSPMAWVKSLRCFMAIPVYNP